MWVRIVSGFISLGRLQKYAGFLALASLPFCAALAGDRTSHWFAKPAIIDGNYDEWPQPFPFKEEVDTKIQYAIANDARTLYLVVKTSDEASKMKLRKNGIIVIIDTTGKKLQHTLFDFSMQDRKKLPGYEDSVAQQAPDITAQAERKLQLVTVRVSGAPIPDGVYQLKDNKPGIAAAAIVNDLNEVVFEIAIPFRCIYAAPAERVSELSKISVCLTLFGLTDAEIMELNRLKETTTKNAMPVFVYDTGKAGSHGRGGNPVRGTNGGTGVSIGDGRGGDADESPSIDANAATLDRQHAAEDNQVWKQLRLSYQP